MRMIVHMNWWGSQDNRIHEGVITAVADFDESGMAKMGCSFCAPGDRFSRKEGVRIATERLDKNPVGCAVLTDDVLQIKLMIRALALAPERFSYRCPDNHWISYLPSWFKSYAKSINGIKRQ